MMTDDFTIGNGLRQGYGLAPNLFNVALNYVITQLSVEVKSTIFYQSVQLLGHADNINIMRRKKGPVSELCEKLKDRAKEVGLNVTVEKTKAKVQNNHK